jgi:hypothetical protein
MSVETYDYPKPTAPFPYVMKTTSIMEHSRGIMWTANLLREGKVVGIIEQMGDGGADRVGFNTVDDRRKWEADVKFAFGGDEEGATFFLLCEEGE